MRIPQGLPRCWEASLVRRMSHESSHPSVSVTRRQFLRASALATASLGFPAIVRAQNLNSKLSIAVIGCGGRGGSNLAEAASKGDNIVALCDVNEQNLAAAAGKHPQAKKFVDFRQLYADLKEFDAVVVSTAEHTDSFQRTLPPNNNPNRQPPASMC